VDPVPYPLLLRKTSSAGNRTRDLWFSSQKLLLLDHRGGPPYTTFREIRNEWTTGYLRIPCNRVRRFQRAICKWMLSSYNSREACPGVVPSSCKWYYFPSSSGANASYLGDIICHKGVEIGDIASTGSYCRSCRRNMVYPTISLLFFSGSRKNSAHYVALWVVYGARRCLTSLI
jgi:hypothetical protein